jgi:hypothetical protein
MLQDILCLLSTVHPRLCTFITVNISYGNLKCLSTHVKTPESLHGFAQNLIEGVSFFYNLLPINCKVSNKWGNKEWHNNYCLQESVAMQCGKLLAAFQRNPLPPSSGQMKPEDEGRRCLWNVDHELPHYMVCHLIKELLLVITTKTSSLMHMEKHPCLKWN